MKPTVYIETSVIGHLTTRPSRNVIMAGHQEATRLWWESHRDRYDLWVSQVVLRESQAGDKQTAEERMQVLVPLRILEISPLDLDLAERLLEAEALPAKASEEALHVAIAATNNLNYLLTWNLKHINNPATKPLIEETIRESGYRPPIIGTPDQLLESMFAVPIVEGRRRFCKAAAASMNFDLRATFDQIKAEEKASGRELFRLNSREPYKATELREKQTRVIDPEEEARAYASFQEALEEVNREDWYRTVLHEGWNTEDGGRI